MSRVFAGGASTDRVAITVYSAIDNLSLLTVAAWIYRTGEGGNNAGRIVCMGSGNVGHLGWDLLNNLATTSINFNATRWPTQGSFRITRPNASEWHHIAVTYDYGSTSNVPVMYLDGVSQSVTTGTPPAGSASAQNETSCGIGQRSATETASRAWDGRIAEPAIWNRILGASEVAGIYARGPLSMPSGLVLYVPMLGDASPEPNYYNGAGNGTVTGTTAGDHPPIPALFMGRRRRTVRVAAAGSLTVSPYPGTWPLARRR